MEDLRLDTFFASALCKTENTELVRWRQRPPPGFLWASVTDSLLHTSSSSRFYETMQASFSPWLQTEIDFSTLLFPLALCLSILCAERENQGLDEMLISLYKCTSTILPKDEEERSGIECWRADDIEWEKKRKTWERICGGSTATGRRCGSSISGMMMMQAHVKS